MEHASADNVNAEIVAIGTELLLGALTDTNSVYLAQQLRDLGINLYFMTSVGDNIDRIVQAITIALSRADVVITCGGLGPTVDDMTREAVARSVGTKLVYHEYLFEAIKERFAAFRANITENNKRQAYLPDGALVIPNPVGTAPSFMAENAEGKIVISLPGVPREMKFLMENAVIPLLRERFKLGIIKARTLKSAGIGESSLDDLLGDELLNHSNPSIGLAAHQGDIDIRITAKADDLATADAMLSEMADKVYEKAGEYIFGEDSDTIESVFSRDLIAHNYTAAFLEAGIDNVLIGRLPGETAQQVVWSHNYDHPKQTVIDASMAYDHTLDMRENAQRFVKYLAEQNNANIAIAVLSLPDVNEGADVEHATAVAVYVNGQISSRGYGFGSKSELSRSWPVRWALSRAWRMFKESEAS
ncbi:MAG: CinA family nicotinamide mononucleotide deamidase-related protein [Anaerolineaceae bacterium]|nr:CinA family nicotinamide mononucleotide deamidase-related protein [Anaerolineaceae bacterium]